MNSLAISIVVWNNPEDALECANSLLTQTIIKKMYILFVDNGSEVENVEQLTKYMGEKNDPRLVIIHTGYNGGTAGGFTAAAKWAESQGIEYIGSLNADAVADEKWCESLLAELEKHEDAGIATGKVLSRDGSIIDSTGEFYTTWGIPGPRGRNEPATKASPKPEYIFGVTGGAFICRMSTYKSVGYYDEKMFMYYEDVDFSFRAQLMGYTARYTPSAIVYHKRGASADTVPGLAVYNTFKNLPVLYLKNVPKELLLKIGVRFGLSYILMLGNSIVRGRGIPAVRGWLSSIILMRYAFSERKRVQSSKTVSADYISSVIIHDIPPDQTGLRKFRSLFTGKA